MCLKSIIEVSCPGIGAVYGCGRGERTSRGRAWRPVPRRPSRVPTRAVGAVGEARWGRGCSPPCCGRQRAGGRAACRGRGGARALGCLQPAPCGLGEGRERRQRILLGVALCFRRSFLLNPLQHKQDFSPVYFIDIKQNYPKLQE